MNIDKFNSEGYYDPTSYEAMTNVAKADKQSAFRPLVYICSPFSGDTEYNSNRQESTAVLPMSRIRFR